MTKRLTPLIDDPSQPQYLRELLDTGRHARVNDYDYSSGLTRHLAQIDAAVPTPHWAESMQPSGAAGAGAAGVAGSSLVAWLAIPLVGASVLAAVMLSSGSEQPSTPTPAVVRSVPATAAAPAEAEPARAEPAVVPSAGRALETPRVHSQQPSAAEPRAQLRPARSQGLRSVQRAAALSGSRSRPAASSASLPTQVARDVKSAPASTATPEAAASKAEEVAITEPEPAAVAQPAQPPADPTPAPIDDARLEREMGMLAISQRVLLSDPARALNLSRQGEAEFSGSMFTQERQQLLLLSLVKLGRLDEAKRLARPYLARYPNGPFSDRVRRALATGRVER